MTNRRTMGQKNGYWIGVEVEKTQFYGMETIFFCRFNALEQAVSQPHVFIALIDPKFFAGFEHLLSVHGLVADHNLQLVMMYVEAHIQQGKYVTIEVDPQQAIALAKYFTPLREKYRGHFCLLIAVEVDKLELQGFSIKVAPATVFETGAYEGGVATVPSEVLTGNLDGLDMEFGMTRWAEYEGDIDG